MLHLSTVESTTLELLKQLQQLPVLCNTRLVGGTALALQLGHRKSGGRYDRRFNIMVDNDMIGLCFHLLTLVFR